MLEGKQNDYMNENKCQKIIGPSKLSGIRDFLRLFIIKMKLTLYKLSILLENYM